ncbi:LysR family transcriptional regulator [Roseibacterium sp. SDUM158016]|jgi:DNA-binding transcriptional LysR family regulator|uniref:LysR family transcriptional regulator n=1 Tax=Roseicyclus sediminis TaxID=2980997 RepID=UPI0021D22292|nr:LysR family transcriptional regulator [Roseibacterium sp. SDUM158016]MCU4653041.1 LysR family transcriptional regulator [Roseibacterium sp. SDUM158016]
MPTALTKGLTLRGLEVFTSLSRTGSVAATASELGLSAPAVSQQMRNLSSALGVELLDHSRRPMTLTPAGRLFLERAETALELLRAGQRDLTQLDLTDLSALSLGVIEDFENEVTPTLAARLAEAMSQCAFRLQTGPSHALAARIADRELDIAICAAYPGNPPGTVPHPLVRDPYILAVPRGTRVDAGLSGLAGLSFLRRDMDQVMGRQIEAYLGRAGLSPPQRFEIDSNQSISALVASGTGWTITTPLSLLRAGRFAGGIDAHPLPGEPVARHIALFATDDWTGPIPQQIATLARELIGTHFLEPGLERMPWLGPAFALLD